MTAAPQAAPESSGDLVSAVLGEIRALLLAFSQAGAAASIDLGGLPLSPRARERLDERLGRGEIAVEADIAGRSEIWETGFAGVWRLRHFGGAGVAADLVEICACPEILRADRRDAGAAAERLGRMLEMEASHET